MIALPVVPAATGAGPAGISGATAPGSPPVAALDAGFDAVFQQLAGSLLAGGGVAGEAAPPVGASNDAAEEQEPAPPLDESAVMSAPVVVVPVMLASIVPQPVVADVIAGDAAADQPAAHTTTAVPIDREDSDAVSSAPASPVAAPVNREMPAEGLIWRDAPAATSAAAPVDGESATAAPIRREGSIAGPVPREAQAHPKAYAVGRAQDTEIAEVAALPARDAANATTRASHDHVPTAPLQRAVVTDAPALSAPDGPTIADVPTTTATPGRAFEIAPAPVRRPHAGTIANGKPEAAAEPAPGPATSTASDPAPHSDAAATTSHAAAILEPPANGPVAVAVTMPSTDVPRAHQPGRVRPRPGTSSPADAASVAAAPAAATDVTPAPPTGAAELAPAATVEAGVARRRAPLQTIPEAVQAAVAASSSAASTRDPGVGAGGPGPSTTVRASRLVSVYDDLQTSSRSTGNGLAERAAPALRVTDAAPAWPDAALVRDRGAVSSDVRPLPREIDPPTGDAIHAQIVRSIRLQWTGGVGEARVTLRPEYLGEVVASISVDRGLVTATLHADTPEVRRWIESHAASLRDALVEHGLRLDRLAVVEPEREAAAGGDRQGRWRGRQQEPPPSRARKRPDSESAATFDLTTE